MNFRIILVVIFIFLFASAMGAMNFISAKGLTLDEAYKNGDVEIIQQTTAGTIPHSITIANKGENPINIEKGSMLTSKSSQDMVIARDDVVLSGAKLTVPAYCIEPGEKAADKSKLKAAGLAPQVIIDIISISNPAQQSEAFNTQIKIWTITGGEDFNVYTGESLAVSQEQGISFYDIKQNMSNAKIEVMTKFNFTENQMNTININSPLLNQSDSIFNQFFSWL
jgi:hypothetical protein